MLEFLRYFMQLFLLSFLSLPCNPNATRTNNLPLLLTSSPHSIDCKNSKRRLPREEWKEEKKTFLLLLFCVRRNLLHAWNEWQRKRELAERRRQTSQLNLLLISFSSFSSQIFKHKKKLHAGTWAFFRWILGLWNGHSNKLIL